MKIGKKFYKYSIEIFQYNADSVSTFVLRKADVVINGL
jgi:hypothetical protein